MLYWKQAVETCWWEEDINFQYTVLDRMTIQVIVQLSNTEGMEFNTAKCQTTHTGRNSLTEFNLGVKISSLSSYIISGKRQIFN